MNLTFVPYGNAKIDLNAKTVSCQHGDVECSGNSYEQCAIEAYPDAADYLPFVGCLASAGSAKMHLDQTFEDCANGASLDFGKIKACHDDVGKAWELQVKYSELTPADHQWTPWVVVDGTLYEDGEFIDVVCEAYTGTKPEACEGKANGKDLRSMNKW